MKRSELFFSFLLVPLDFAMIILAGVSAYYIRFAEFTTEIRPAIFNLPFGDYFKAVVFIAIAWLAVFALSGLYNIKDARKLSKEIIRVILACSTGFVLIVILIFFRRELFDSRFIVLAGWILAIIYIGLSRALIRLLQRCLFKYGIGVHKVILVGDSRTTDNLMHYYSSAKNSGFEVVKRLRNFDMEAAENLAEIIKIKEVDEIIQSDPGLSKEDVLRLYDFADEHHLTFKYAADLLGTKVLKTEVAQTAGIPIVEVKKTPLDGWGRIVKRMFDILGSSVLIILLSPILLFVVLMIKLDSHGPVFFSRRDDGSPVHRVGQGGRPFRYFKFRSMVTGMDSKRYTELADRNIRDDGPMVKIKDDPRVTRFGKFIRRWSIDELAELFLVMKGDLSLVGPRPHLPEEVAKYEHHHKKSLTIKPGMTGLAQISGRSDLSFDEEVKLDTYYIENWSLFLDLMILLRTPLAVLRNRATE
ncbi:MAG: exopolysaccharide biosynthesis polyprenyl glycosylphosphotransferase [Actinobacteria bacterium]|nr:exopolysaccharide biosynthesis polyprenyl glycosylphosphotransferase [Actinomycetota bacterium]